MDILIKNGLINIAAENNGVRGSSSIVATLLNNISYYGYALTIDGFEALHSMTEAELKRWWADVEPAFKKLTGDDKKMDDFVVYKNFPAEVLSMSEGEYWFKQILMYWGFPNKYFTEEAKSRPQMLEQRSFKVLHLADSDSYQKILNNLLLSPARWTKDQWDDVCRLIEKGLSVNSNIPFKENFIRVAEVMIANEIPMDIKSATDVMRLAVGLSNGDITLKTNSKFRNFARRERKYLLRLLDGATSLEEDFARDKNRWKKLLYKLHPGDYGFYTNVVKAYNSLYNDEVRSFNSSIELMLANNNAEVLDVLSSRPGELVRRIRVLIDKFGKDLSKVFKQDKFLRKLSVSQLLKTKKYLTTINNRNYRIFPPKGNWTKLQSVENKIKLSGNVVNSLVAIIDKEIFRRVSEAMKIKYVDPNLSQVKLQTNDSDILPYGRGTIFDIPQNMNFIRTASYWKNKSSCNTWFDNGWLFYDNNWKPLAACCWNNTSCAGAVFSGDPTNSKDMQGRACQMIDLYIDQLVNRNIRYAVWNILCYSRIKFSDAEEVYGTLQWGENPESGKLYEPSRAQLSFPITSDSYTKYVAYIDLVERKLVYMDANLPSKTNSAYSNLEKMSDLMPKFVEYLDTLPSVYDLFKDYKPDENGIQLVYSDAEKAINDEYAYVFKQENQDSKFKQFDINKLLV